MLCVADDGGIYSGSQPAVANPTFVALNQTLNTLTFYPATFLAPVRKNVSFRQACTGQKQYPWPSQ